MASPIYESQEDHLCTAGWSRALVAAGVGAFGMYSLRHFFASRLLAAGEPLAYVQKQLGHANQNMTLSHYSRFIPDRRQARGADRLMAELLTTEPQPNESRRARTSPVHSGEVSALGPMNTGDSGRARSTLR